MLTRPWIERSIFLIQSVRLILHSNMSSRVTSEIQLCRVFRGPRFHGTNKREEKGKTKRGEIRKVHGFARAAHLENKNKTRKETPRCFLCEAKCDFLVERESRGWAGALSEQEINIWAFGFLRFAIFSTIREWKWAGGLSSERNSLPLGLDFTIQPCRDSLLLPTLEY